MRLFLAITLPGPWKRALADAAGLLRDNSRRGTFTRRENFHLTLAFLGELPDPAPVCAAMAQVSGEPFSLRLGAPGRFPGKDGDIWWAGLEPSPELDALHSALCASLEGMGLPGGETDRPFRPHLTLGRRVVLREGFDPRRLEEALPPLELTVASFALMRSTRPAGILTYTPLCRRLLNGDLSAP